MPSSALPYQSSFFSFLNIKLTLVFTWSWMTYSSSWYDMNQWACADLTRCLKILVILCVTHIGVQWSLNAYGDLMVKQPNSSMQIHYKLACIHKAEFQITHSNCFSVSQILLVQAIGRFRFPRCPGFWTFVITSSCVIWCHVFRLKFRRCKQTWNLSFSVWPLTCAHDVTHTQAFTFR